MLELTRIRPESPADSNWAASKPAGLVMGLARTNEELESIQRLRYNVFTEEMHAVFPDAVDGLDADRYDPWCEHLMVKDSGTDQVVGTYRLLTPAHALKAGGYYSETEFDLSGLGALRDNIVEVGRSCIHSDYRNGSVIMLLWAGIASVVQQYGFRYVLGCASVSLRDDGVTAAEVWRTAKRHMDAATGLPRVIPRHHYPVERVSSVLPARMPPLIKGYLKLGATICGAPAWDPDFNTADFPILLDLTRMDARYRRHFGLD